MTTQNPIDIFDHLEPREGGEGLRRIARFLWIDSESGEELSVEVTGGEEFFEKLENLGFERQSRDAAGDPRRSKRVRRRARMNVWPAGKARADQRARRGA